MYPYYSTNLVPSICCLFLSVPHDLIGEEMSSRDACANQLSQFFVNSKKDFNERDTMTVPSTRTRTLAKRILGKAAKIMLPKSLVLRHCALDGSNNKTAADLREIGKLRNLLNHKMWQRKAKFRFVLQRLYISMHCYIYIYIYPYVPLLYIY